MRRIWVRYLTEAVIHVLFWAGVYYALKALTFSSYNLKVKIGPDGTQNIDGVVQFGYIRAVFGFLLLLFYSNSLWLFKKVIRYKSGARRVAVIAGWFILILAMNYVVINWRHNTAGKMMFRDIRLPGGPDAADPPWGRHPVETPGMPSGAQPPRGPHADGKPDLASQPFFIPEENRVHTQVTMALVFLAVLAVAIAQFFIREWIRNDLTRSQAEAQQLRTELKFLRSQVNPHFLFNTLNNLFSMAQKKGNHELADGISKLSGLMRYMIYESDTGKVYLQKEIDYLKNYIALNKLRYADSEVAVSFSHPPAAAIAEVQVAPILFIPFVENAFKHGVSIGHRSCIALAIAVEADRLVFTCENADHSAVRKLAAERSGIGLANVKRHLELVYPGGHELRTVCGDGKYSVYLQIDLA